MSKLAMVAGVLLGASAVSAAPVIVIDGDGNLAGTYTGGTTYVTYGQTVGGLGAAEVAFVGRNNEQTLTANNPRPVLADNTILRAEVYVDATEDTEVIPQGLNRMKVILRNPDGGDQETHWIGAAPGEAFSEGVGFHPTQAGEWQTFEYDFSGESWYSASYASFEVYRVFINESDRIPADNPDGLTNNFAIRNVMLDVPEPGSLSLIGMGLGTLLLRRRR